MQLFCKTQCLNCIVIFKMTCNDSKDYNRPKESH